MLERVLDYPRLVLLAAGLFCALGFIALFDLPKERAPRIKLPVVMVAVPNPGAPPAINEAQIIRKVEQQVGAGLKGLRDRGAVLSQAVHGAAMMQFIFEDSVDVEKAEQDVKALIDRVKGEFPGSAEEPIIGDIAFEDFPIIQVFVAGGADGRQRRRIADRLKEEIEDVPGVGGVDIFGGLEDEVQIEVDPHLMTLYGFTYAQVEGAIRQANALAPSGAIESAGGSDQRVRTDSGLKSLDEIRRVPLGTHDGRPITLGDIAEVRLGHKPLKSLARYAGEDAVVLLARPKTDIDVLAAADAIQQTVDRFVATGAGESTRIGTVRSQAREIRYMIEQLSTNAWQGTVLVILMLWIAFGWRNAAMISMAFPFCLLVTAGLMWIAKQTFYPNLAINNMVLFALILVVGEVADGSIVIGENIYRHRELGRSPVDAAKFALREVGPPIVFAYLTTVASFAPLFLVRGVMGEFLETLPIVTIFALVAALLVDHFLLPVVSVYVMKPARRVVAGVKGASAGSDPSPSQGEGAAVSGGGRGYRAEASRELASSPTHSTPAAQPPPQPSPDVRGQGEGAGAAALSQEDEEIANAELLVRDSRLKRVYGEWLEHALRHRRTVLAATLAAILIPIALFGVGAVGFELFPEADVPVVEVHFELRLGASMEKRTAAVAAELEAAVNRAVLPEEWYRPSDTAERVGPVTTIGETGALTTRLDAGQGSGPEFGMVYVELEMAEDRARTAGEIRRAIEAEIPPLPGVLVRVSSPKEGPPAGAPVLVRVLAQRETPLEELAAQAAEIEQTLRQIPGTRDVASDYRVRPELVATPDRAIASLFGIDAAQIANSVNYALDGVIVGDVDFGGDEEIDLRLRNAAAERSLVADLANLPLKAPDGTIVTVDQVADVDRVSSAHVVQHYDQRRVIHVRADLAPGVLPDDVKAALVEALRPELGAAQRHALVHDHTNLVLRSDERTTIEFGGENQIRDQAFVDLNLALAIALLGNFLLLVFYFNNFRQPLIIVLSVPLSFIGVAIGLLLWGLHFSVSAMIGVVALSGIVVDNALVMIDFCNKMRAAGVPANKAVVYAAQLRVRPIILTTLTNVVAMIPVTLNLAGGGELWVPLSVAIMAGLSFATLVQLFVVPVAYYTFCSGPEPATKAERRLPAAEPVPA